MKTKDLKMYISLEVVRIIGELQSDIANECEGNYLESLISFEYMGHTIIDPFTDESGSHSVNPVHYYGKAFTESAWKKYL